MVGSGEEAIKRPKEKRREQRPEKKSFLLFHFHSDSIFDMKLHTILLVHNTINCLGSYGNYKLLSIFVVTGNMFLYFMLRKSIKLKWKRTKKPSQLWFVWAFQGSVISWWCQLFFIVSEDSTDNGKDASWT